MNKYILLFLTALLLQSCRHLIDGMSGATKNYDPNGNSLYHRTDETQLKVGELQVLGEVKKPGKVKLKNFYKREVFCKQAVPDSATEIAFIGAYRYRGYSLFDLLNPFIAEKKNAEAFRPSIDLYIIIENDKGDRVVFSWSEIYHTHNPHQIIIATEWAPIKPYKKEVDYPNANLWKVVAANDMFAFRELENPTKITVKSFDKKEYEINRDLKDPFTPTVRLVVNNEEVNQIDSTTVGLFKTEYNSIFYGMGMGYHHAASLRGIELQKVVLPYVKSAKQMSRNGLVCFAGLDGYRAVYSFSELFNRVDQVKPILAIPNKGDKNGYFRIYNPMDFYADRSVKGLAEIFLFMEL